MTPAVRKSRREDRGGGAGGVEAKQWSMKVHSPRGIWRRMAAGGSALSPKGRPEKWARGRDGGGLGELASPLLPRAAGTSDAFAAPLCPPPPPPPRPAARPRTPTPPTSHYSHQVAWLPSAIRHLRMP
ncbi:hypothetical protein E2C01_065541 [Portunus trituberculatus]|uniref:Uncharacterized protein n=1 Tax=Portunus trituberculatus TaxID=210409 RepID=A0A5B7HFU8_PORTR|nr:hypothetical protein [Portunus trituberculatus]